ncbi:MULTISPECIES: GMC family oxidoreductase [Bradyrhizobium]|uniref:GMC family oxidoreductase n=2 Tax=Nitrobacteraceae TaxID=41294 RepID=UPI00039DFF10|nr:GMC family oxidoreductase N-terminal domain-containing protein [Bradyrhizobium denitrificans]MCL8486826.1 GMC family oxidoreductase N-terminal domain-containing protein [Bradyrhizobium denitrificans]
MSTIEAAVSTPAAVVAISRRPIRSAYDYIVIGAGSGGTAVTRRLVDAGADVLLIEAGPSGIGIADIDDPTKWMSLGRGAYDWGYDYAPTPHVDNRIIGIPRGKVLGGSSSINAMMWYRGHPADYDAWEASGALGWAFKDVLPYFKRCEDWEGGASEWRGAGGPLRIERSRVLHPVAAALIEAAAELGLPVIDDPNGATNEGAAPSNFNISDGKRFNSAQAYLWPVLDKDNLTVLPDSEVTQLTFVGRRCVAVKHLMDGTEVETRATIEIILALGAINTPRLLMLSGVGDPAELGRLGIVVKAALPGVGRNLQDHPLVRAVNFRSKGPLGAVTDNGGGSMLNWKSNAGQSRPNVHAFPVQGRSAVAGLGDKYDLSGNVFAIGTGLMRSRSRGYMRLLGTNPGSPIEIQPNFLLEPEDVGDLVDAVDLMIELGATKAYADWFDGYAAPERRLNRANMVQFIRAACSTFFHTCGTAKMGDDSLSVVDERLAVHGLEGLRIADASVIPIIPSCNTHAPVTMIGERAADFILESARKLRL